MIHRLKMAGLGRSSLDQYLLRPFGGDPGVDLGVPTARRIIPARRIIL
jgi:hypothetical protein